MAQTCGATVGRRAEDWEPTLATDEVEILSKWALRLAKELNQQVQLMALARIGGVRGPNACLPWHYTNFQIPHYTESVRKLPMTKQVRVLSSFEDLNSAFVSESTVQVYVLRPVPKFLRDTAFLKSVGEFVARNSAPLYFEGSLLGHAYYVLSSAGAHVVPIVDEPAADAKPYYKLVRDEIPAIIQHAGGLARLRTISKQDARIFLARKLLEEATGLLHFPHDSYFYYPNEGRVDKTINFKGLCLLFEDGAWTYSEVGRPEHREPGDESIRASGIRT